MIYGSVCSGIEAASVAWHPLGWRPAFFSEIEAFPRAVLKHHYPDVPLHGDFTTIREGQYAAIDVLVGGTPCQSFSVAGLRGGLADDRGNLALEYLRLAQRLRPEWLVWENVPGVLSSNGGRDFGSILGGLVELGYGFAYRVLDAQYVRTHGFLRAVPQRRRRVFVVGHLGDWRRAAAVLFERESLQGHPPPGRQAGQGSAGDVANCLRSSSSPNGHGHSHGLRGDGADNLVAKCLTSHATRIDAETETFVAHALRADGFDASEDGTGRGTPLVPICFSAKDHGADAMDDCSPTLRAGGFTTSHANAGVMPAIAYQNGERHARAPETHAGALLRRVRDALGAEAFAEWGLGILDTLQPAEILQSALHGSELRPAAFSRRWVVYCALSRTEARAEGAMQSMREARRSGCASQGREPSEQLARELGAYLSELPQPGAQAERLMHDLWQAAEGLGALRQALSAVEKARRPARGEDQSTFAPWRVRRLTVEECEFLQGFPRGYTAVPYRGKPAADGPRYKALGNSMACNVMRWIGQRIEAVAARSQALEAAE